MKLKNVLAIMAIGVFATACSDDNNDPKWGDVVADKVTNLDVSAYDKWTYINLETGATETHADTGEWIYTDGTTTPAKAEEPVGIDWHIAIHRYEMRTNGGEVLDTRQTNMDVVTELPAGTYAKDEVFPYEEDGEFQVITDMSKMMTEYSVGYAKKATLNKVLCGWVKKTETGTMPPVLYEPTKNVMVLKCKDGSWAKLQFMYAGNTDTGKSGFVTFNYEFIPLNK